MEHKMNLNPEPFEMIRSGQKTIELRLNDEKRKQIKVGDIIEFTQTETGEKLITKVIAVHRFDSFAELYQELPLLKCGYTESDIASAKPEDMDLYYTPEQQEKYGVLGIEIKLLDKLTHSKISELIIEYLINKIDGNWHREKVEEKKTHEPGVDIKMVGGKSNGERFFIECKAKSYAKSADSINREGWLNALGQIVTRMNTKPTIASGTHKGEPNRSYKYGLGLCWESAKVALRRIPREIAKTLTLHIFSVYDDGFVKQWKPKDFGKSYTEEDFKNPTEQ